MTKNRIKAFLKNGVTGEISVDRHGLKFTFKGLTNFSKVRDAFDSTCIRMESLVYPEGDEYEFYLTNDLKPQNVEYLDDLSIKDVELS